MSMTVIEHIELESDTGVVSFDLSGVQSYTDLMIVMSVRTTASNPEGISMTYQFNDSTSGYSARALNGNGSAANSYSVTTSTLDDGTTGGRIGDGFVAPSGYTADTFSNCSWYIPNYTGSSAKSWSFDAVSENNSTTADQEIIAGLWTGTDAITKIDVSVSGTRDFAALSSFTIYGITAGSSGGVTVS